MFESKRASVIILATVLCFTGCQGKESQSTSAQGQKVLAKVNGTPIKSEDLNFRPQMDHRGSEDRPRSLDDIINLELFYQQGVKLGLDKDPSYRAKLAKLEKQPAAAKRVEMARRVFNTQIASTINLMPKDAREFYDHNKDLFSTELHLQYMKFDDRQKAIDALKQLRAGASFASIARPVMGDAKKNGREPWDLGFQKWQEIPVDFVEPVYRLQPGEQSDVLGSLQTGFQIVRLVERRTVPVPEFGPMQGVVMNRLRDLKLLEAYNRYVEQLRKDAKIEKF